ncbi:hypothetical protein HN587_04525 [Candidatus Woesearchaeota archaeon]|jgi:hypothetical protein|nr:hypothetical protein [Candidatus Woesearchaeota archaeon]
MDALETILTSTITGIGIYQAATIPDPVSVGFNVFTAGTTPMGKYLRYISSPSGIFAGLYSAVISAGENKPLNVALGIVMAASSLTLLIYSATKTNEQTSDSTNQKKP